MTVKGSRLRPAMYRLLALGIGLAVALVAVEIALRAFDLAPAGGVATVTSPDFGRIPGIFLPGQRLIDRRKPDLAHRVTVDSLGYRGDDFPRRKPEGEYRIVFIGDSGTWGDFVDDDETLPAQLEAYLQPLCANVRVVNAGLGGSSILSQVHMARRSLAIDPDLVLLKFNENDVDDLLQTPIWERIASNRRAKSRFPLSIVYPALRHTALWNLGLTVRARTRNRETGRRKSELRRQSEAERSPNMGATAGVGPEAQDSEEARRRIYAEALASLRDELDAAGIAFAFVISPAHQTVAGTRDTELLDWATETAQGLSIPTIDLLGPLEASGLAIEELYLLPRDGHASARGYGVAAEALASALGTMYLDSDSCPANEDAPGRRSTEAVLPNPALSAGREPGA